MLIFLMFFYVNYYLDMFLHMKLVVNPVKNDSPYTNNTITMAKLAV